LLDVPAGIALAVAGWAVVRRVVGVVWPMELPRPL
jgi:hypothetical protein